MSYGRYVSYFQQPDLTKPPKAPKKSASGVNALCNLQRYVTQKRYRVLSIFQISKTEIFVDFFKSGKVLEI